MAQVLLVADRPNTVVQAGLPSATMAAWLLDVPPGSTAIEAVYQFAAEQTFPVGTVARIIDLDAHGDVVLVFELEPQWVSHQGS